MSQEIHMIRLAQDAQTQAAIDDVAKRKRQDDQDDQEASKTIKAQMTAQIDAVMKSAAVQRHHANRTNATQSVGEHTYGVLWILVMIAPATLNLKIFLAALAHDTPEYVTGDIPAPAKRSGFVDTNALKEFEARIMNDAGLVGCNSTLTDSEIALLKLADNLEGAAWYADEVISGNWHASAPLNQYVRWLNKTVHTNDRAAILLDIIKEKVYEYNPTYKFV